MMRRPVWWVVGIAVLALWAWSQRGASPRTSDDARSSDSALPAHSPASQRTHDDASPSRDPRTSGPSPRGSGSSSTSSSATAWLPEEARQTLRLIAQGGPYPHRQDGVPFQNRERRLPAQSRGYYREFTVETPGSRDRGARRIISGGDPPAEYFYTDDHYRTFRRFTAETTR